MKKINITILGLILLISLVTFSGCGEVAEPPPELNEILNIQKNCPANNESLSICCENDCNRFCQKNQRAYFRHDINVKEPIRHCLCWCS